MMKSVIVFLIIFFSLVCLTPLVAQTSFEELEFEVDSIKTPYTPDSKNYVFIRSKRGNSGVNKTASADAILSSEVSEIVLVFSETNASAIEERETANRERWENLLLTYPDFFQYSTTYKTICQCNTKGDDEGFKKVQGFYVFVEGELPNVAAEPKTTKTIPEVVTPQGTEKIKEEKNDEAVVSDHRKESIIAETKAKDKDVEENNSTEAEDKVVAPVKEKPKKEVTASKPRRAKDPKACRPPCYGYGDEDLLLFFKENLTITKKQKRKAKSWMANVRLQIHFDGSIKKVIVTGSDQDFNKLLEEVLKSMNNWNSAVKGGIAVKSEVRFTVKYDKNSKAFKPFEINMNPRPSAKCRCESDSEIFGSN